MANNFNYFSPTEVVFGIGTENHVGTLIKKYHGSKVLIHYGGNSAIRLGLIDRVKTLLDAEGIPHTELGVLFQTLIFLKYTKN